MSADAAQLDLNPGVHISFLINFLNSILNLDLNALRLTVLDSIHGTRLTIFITMMRRSDNFINHNQLWTQQTLANLSKLRRLDGSDNQPDILRD